MPAKYVNERMMIGAQLLGALPDICEARYGVKDGEFFRSMGKAGYELRYSADGPVCAFLPPNDPAEVFFLYAHAVLSGQSLVIKPSSAEPLTSMVLAQAINKEGYVPGGLNVVHWNTANPLRTALGAVLCKESAIRIIMGSKGTLQSVLGGDARNVVEYAAGNTASVVFPDADIDRAAGCIVESGYNWTIDCVSTKTVIVVGEKTRDELVARMAQKLASKKVSHPLFADTDVGYVSGQVINSIEELLAGQSAFSAVKCHAPVGRLSAVQMMPILCEASSINSPFFKRELPYVVSLLVCTNERELSHVFNQLSDDLPDRRRMGLGMYSDRHIGNLLPLVKESRAHMIFQNIPTTKLNFELRHQDRFLSDELLVPVSVTK